MRYIMDDKKRKGQGALEYLIIIAGVLAIAAIVLYVVSGAAGTSKKRNIETNCQQAASHCALKKQISTDFDCQPMCAAACADPSEGNKDIMSGTTIPPGTATCPSGAKACNTCADGNVTGISYTWSGSQSQQGGGQ